MRDRGNPLEHLTSLKVFLGPLFFSRLLRERMMSRSMTWKSPMAATDEALGGSRVRNKKLDSFPDQNHNPFALHSIGWANLDKVSMKAFTVSVTMAATGEALEIVELENRNKN